MLPPTVGSRHFNMLVLVTNIAHYTPIQQLSNISHLVDRSFDVQNTILFLFKARLPVILRSKKLNKFIHKLHLLMISLDMSTKMLNLAGAALVFDLKTVHSYFFSLDSIFFFFSMLGC